MPYHVMRRHVPLLWSTTRDRCRMPCASQAKSTTHTLLAEADMQERRAMAAQAGPSDAVVGAAAFSGSGGAEGFGGSQEGEFEADEGEGEDYGAMAASPAGGAADDYGFPEPPGRAWCLPDLFAAALEVGTAKRLDKGAWMGECEKDGWAS